LVQIIAKKTALTLSNLLLRDQIQHQAICDPLTGLFNRRYFQETLEREIHREAGTLSSIGIVMIDVDNSLIESADRALYSALATRAKLHCCV